MVTSLEPDKRRRQQQVFIWSNDGQIKALCWPLYGQWYPMVVIGFFVGLITALY